MAKQYIPSHTLPYNCDFNMSPINRRSLIPLTLSPDGFVTTLTTEAHGSDIDFQDWVIKGDAAFTLSLDHLLLEP